MSKLCMTRTINLSENWPYMRGGCTKGRSIDLLDWQCKSIGFLVEANYYWKNDKIMQFETQS